MANAIRKQAMEGMFCCDMVAEGNVIKRIGAN